MRLWDGLSDFATRPLPLRLADAKALAPACSEKWLKTCHTLGAVGNVKKNTAKINQNNQTLRDVTLRFELFPWT